jgi:uncharacterized phiE125 gp8 family phage protein
MALQTVPNQTITEPVTLAELKARIQLTSTADDAKLTGLITAAREFAERITNRCLAARQFVDYRDGFPFPSDDMQIPAPPLVSVDIVEYLDSTYTYQTWDASEYFVAEHNVPAVLRPRIGKTYPCPVRSRDSVRVTFTAGAGRIDGMPEHWKLNLMDIAIFMYENAGVKVPDTLVNIPKIYVF